MSDKNIKNAPENVQKHYNFDHSVRYRKDAVKRWPCSEYQEEISYGYTGCAIDRTTGHYVHVLQWGTFNYEVKIERDNMDVWVNPCLLVVEKKFRKNMTIKINGKTFVVFEEEFGNVEIHFSDNGVEKRIVSDLAFKKFPNHDYISEKEFGEGFINKLTNFYFDLCK